MSGALDRLHYEKDPCVRYDAPRKVWIYLHRGRTEEDFGMYMYMYQSMLCMHEIHDIVPVFTYYLPSPVLLSKLSNNSVVS